MKKNGRTLREAILYEKSKMLPLNFKITYIFTPIYTTVSLLLLAAFAFMMYLDSEKLFCVGIFFLSLVGLLTLGMVFLIFSARKRAVEFEMKRYNFDISNEPELEVWDFSTEKLSLVFKSCGMFLNGEFHHFDVLQKAVFTNNHCKRINIFVVFIVSETEYVSFELDDPRIIKMIKTFRVKLDNDFTFDYILENKKLAFQAIYDKGYC